MDVTPLLPGTFHSGHCPLNHESKIEIFRGVPQPHTRVSGPVRVTEQSLSMPYICTHTHVYISCVNDIMQYSSYLRLVISRSIMSSRFIHVVANGKLNTFHSSTDRHLGLIPYHSYYD